MPITCASGSAAYSVSTPLVCQRLCCALMAVSGVVECDGIACHVALHCPSFRCGHQDHRYVLWDNDREGRADQEAHSEHADGLEGHCCCQFGAARAAPLSVVREWKFLVGGALECCASTS